MAKLSIAALKRRLTEGVEYTGEFIGKNATICRPGLQVTRRVVVSNKSDLVSRFIDGPKAGGTIYLPWNGKTADERDGSIYVSNSHVNPPEEFLKITL
jgi:hypothetical protein